MEPLVLEAATLCLAFHDDSGVAFVACPELQESWGPTHSKAHSIRMSQGQHSSKRRVYGDHMGLLIGGLQGP